MINSEDQFPNQNKNQVITFEPIPEIGTNRFAAYLNVYSSSGLPVSLQSSNSSILSFEELSDSYRISSRFNGTSSRGLRLGLLGQHFIPSGDIVYGYLSGFTGQNAEELNNGGWIRLISIDPKMLEVENSFNFEIDDPSEEARVELSTQVYVDEAGEVTITASQEGNDEYFPATTVEQTIKVVGPPKWADTQEVFDYNEGGTDPIFFDSTLDDGGSVNITYSLTGEFAEIFSLDAENGTISFVEPPDYESLLLSHTYLVVRVLAENIAGSDTKHIGIVVRNINDEISTVSITGENGTQTGDGEYLEGSTVQLTATPNAGYQFDSWTVNSGFASIRDNSFTMPAEDVSITANYTAIDYTVTVDGTNGNETGSGTYNAGETVTLSATPESGYTFGSWTLNEPIDLNILYGNGWTQVGSDIDGEAQDDQSGTSVALSSDGSIVAIGAPANDGYGSTSSGHVRIYQNTNGTWTQIGSDIDGEVRYDLSGGAVALSSDGSIVAIGAHWNDGSGNNSGHVRVYENINGTWTQVGLDIDGEDGDNNSGESVALSSDGSIVAIGAGDNRNPDGLFTGHVRVYQRDDNATLGWTQVGSDIDGEATYDQSGYSVALSADGSIVAIGAPYNDGSGTNSGHVRVYENVNGTWNKIGSDIDGEAAYDRSGTSVALSSDGSIVAIGAIYNEVNGSSFGHVRVYENIDGTWTQLGSDIDGEAVGDNSGGGWHLAQMDLLWQLGLGLMMETEPALDMLGYTKISTVLGHNLDRTLTEKLQVMKVDDL